MPKPYIHNSSHKNRIRDKWVEYLELVLKGENRHGSDKTISVITFPAEEMQDLLLFAEKGLLQFKDTETGDYSLTKGKIICFEKNQKIWRYLKDKLVNATVEQDFEKFIIDNARKITLGHIDIFPVDCINLDYDANITKNKLPITIVIDRLFDFQSIHKKNFCLFLTWPKPFNVDQDEPGSFDNLIRVIRNNLTDPNATNFANRFNNHYKSIDNLSYEVVSIVGLSKQILNHSSTHGYKLENNEFFFYGESGRQKMLSVLYYFKYIGDVKPNHQIYSEDVARTLDLIQVIT